MWCRSSGSSTHGFGGLPWPLPAIGASHHGCIDHACHLHWLSPGDAFPLLSSRARCPRDRRIQIPDGVHAKTATRWSLCVFRIFQNVSNDDKKTTTRPEHLPAGRRASLVLCCRASRAGFIVRGIFIAVALNRRVVAVHKCCMLVYCGRKLHVVWKTACRSFFRTSVCGRWSISKHRCAHGLLPVAREFVRMLDNAGAARSSMLMFVMSR